MILKGAAAISSANTKAERPTLPQLTGSPSREQIQKVLSRYQIYINLGYVNGRDMRLVKISGDLKNIDRANEELKRCYQAVLKYYSDSPTLYRLVSTDTFD